MKTKFFNSIVALSLVTTTLLFSACGSDSTTTTLPHPDASPAIPDAVLTAIDSPAVELTQETKDTLAYMGNEERLAYDVYMELYKYHLENSDLEIKQLTNIATNAEMNHLKTVQLLVEKYITDLSEFSNTNSDRDQELSLDMNFTSYSVEELPTGEYNIDVIQELYDALMAKGQQSEQDALEVGCMVEVTDINDLDEDLAIATASNADDIVVAFEYLRDGSYSHYWSFDNSLKNMGIEDGCCSLGDDFCHPEYPQTENENGNGQGHGNH